MKLKDCIKTMLLSGLLLAGATSCTDWLDVKMEDRIMENKLYSENEGFLIALNGVYLKLNDLYTSDLSAGILDVMAQYYNVTANDDHVYKIYAAYKYDDEAFETKNGSIWGKMYEILANINTILLHCDEDGSALQGDYYPIVKGEALALRAMLHFDLLRLYGPVYNPSSALTECIPYQSDASRNINPLLQAKEVLGKVIDDLEKAAVLLKEKDPIITDGVGVVVPDDNGISHYDFSYRQLRLNYYAVQALRARAYLWEGNKTRAYQIAKNEILDKVKVENAEIFPWTTLEAYDKEGKEDYMFSSEVFFALYNSKRMEMFSQLFANFLNPRSMRLTFKGEGLTGDSKVATLYDDDNDWRRKMWNVSEPSEQEQANAEEKGEIASNSLYLLKYQDFKKDAPYNGSEIYRYMVPLIRLSEIYLIAAECSSDPQETRCYINEIRRHRECQDLVGDDSQLSDAITKEFAKEVIGEGQLFFYYKRLAKEELIAGTSADGTYSMVLSNYVWPLPKVETDKRITISNK